MTAQTDHSHGTRDAADIDDLTAVQADVDRIVSAATAEARRLRRQAGEYGAAFAKRQKNGIANAISDAAEGLRDTADTLEDRPNVRAIVDQASASLEDIAERIREMSFADLYEEAETYARTHPILVAAFAAGAGLAAARFVKNLANRSPRAAYCDSDNDTARGHRDRSA